MKDLMSLVAICKADLDNLGIKYGNVSKWSINTRAKCRLGLCKIITNDIFEINISEEVLKDDIDVQVALNVIMHELLHTVKGCFNHGKKWKTYAEYINNKLPQYSIKRAIKGEESGIKFERKPPVYRYILRCTKCGQKIKRQKETKVVTNYKRYRCGKCGGKLERIK